MKLIRELLAWLDMRAAQAARFDDHLARGAA